MLIRHSRFALQGATAPLRVFVQAARRRSQLNCHRCSPQLLQSVRCAHTHILFLQRQPKSSNLPTPQITPPASFDNITSWNTGANYSVTACTRSLSRPIRRGFRGISRRDSTFRSLLFSSFLPNDLSSHGPRLQSRWQTMRARALLPSPTTLVTGCRHSLKCSVGGHSLLSICSPSTFT
jgi:hypothetical protein